MATFLQRLLGGGRGPERRSSRDVATERLRLVLVHDRASVAPDLMPALRKEILGVLRRYLEIDEAAVRLELDRIEDAVALTATIPVRRIKSRG